MGPGIGINAERAEDTERTEGEKREDKKGGTTPEVWGCWARWRLTIKDHVTTESTYLSRKL